MTRHNLNIFSTSQSEGAKPLLPGWLTKPSPGKEEISQTSSGQNFHEPCARKWKSHHKKSEDFSNFQLEKISEKKRTKKLKEKKRKPPAIPMQEGKEKEERKRTNKRFAKKLFPAQRH